MNVCYVVLNRSLSQNIGNCLKISQKPFTRPYTGDMGDFPHDKKGRQTLGLPPRLILTRTSDEDPINDAR